MHTPPLSQPGIMATGQWSKRPGAPRFTARSGSLPPCRPLVMAARLFVPATVAGAAWTAFWIGSFYALLLALWVCWATVAVARALPAGGPALFRQAACGERIWLNEIRQGHRPVGLGVIPALYLAVWSGVAVCITGGVFLSPLVTGTGLIVAIVSQTICLRRLAGFYQREKENHPLYRFWEAQPANDDSPLLPRDGQDGALPYRRSGQRPSTR